MILSSITIPLAGMVDTAVVGHLDDVRYLAAVALAASLFAFLFMIFNFLRMGVTGRTAQFFGAADESAIARTLAQGLTIAVLIGMLLIIFRQPLVELGMWVMGAPEAVSDDARRYFFIRIYGAPFVLGTYVLTGWFIGLHKARAVLVLLLLNNGINMALDLLFVPGMGMAVEGVALATVVADILAFAWGCQVAVRQEGVLRQLRRDGRLFVAGEAAQLFHLNKNLFLRTVALMSVFTFFTAQGARQEAVVLAANAVLLNMFVLAAFGLDGFAYAAEALAGHALGRRDLAGFGKALRLTAFWSLLQAIFIALVFAVIGTQWIAWLTTLPEVRLAAGDYLGWVVVLPLVGVWAFWLDGVFVGATLSRDMRDTMLLSVIGFFIAWYLLLPLRNHGLWLAMLLFFALRGVLLAFRLRRQYPELLHR